MIRQPELPPSPLEPEAGEPGYVPSIQVVDALRQSIDLASEWLVIDHDRITSPQQARATLRDALRLVDVLQRRLTTGKLIDVRRNDGKTSK